MSLCGIRYMTDCLTNRVLLRSGRPTAVLLTVLWLLRQQQPALDGTRARRGARTHTQNGAGISRL